MVILNSLSCLDNNKVNCLDKYEHLLYCDEWIRTENPHSARYNDATLTFAQLKHCPTNDL